MSLALFAKITTGVVKGRFYRFRYRCLNEVGFGEFSDIAYIMAASKPTVPSLITARFSGSDIVVEWTMPYNSASLISLAEIKFLNSDGVTFSNELQYCDGSTQAVFDARSCTIPSAVLR